MKFLLIVGFLVGFGAVLAAAGFLPLGAQERLPSHTSVANNGGRIETFVIRLPADRIAATGGAGAGIAHRDAEPRIEPPAALAGTPFALEQYKLRNVDGEVVGVAARQWTTSTEGEGGATWMISMPARGTLVWSAADNAAAAITAALTAAGAQTGVAWQGELSVAVAVGDAAGTVVTGTEEFDGNTGRVEEIWEVTGVDGAGELRGTVTLNTMVNQSS